MRRSTVWFASILLTFALARPGMAADDIAFSLVHKHYRLDVPIAELVQVLAARDSRTGEPVIKMLIRGGSARQLEFITKRIIGQPMQIVVGCRVVTAPIVQDVLKGGSLQISGRYSIEEAEELAATIRSGSAHCEKSVT